ncbi:MAG: hypothetical protein VX379_10435 [Pseudomonadota bacterium]|jgi:hypothetical protein|uniref:hypothetical protein n=1 Tax=Alcanivorax sp. TaxID=1872427 RepID=UPI0025BD7AC1|nr:hypothetical protein [Alcanivorax sp.]MED5239982.1 hypothetical protein [Pseudomonadota bacterium]MEE3320851.1 hypothetical protein [Pseudomonadota bacterium]
MKRLAYLFFLISALPVWVQAEEAEQETKEISGMSVMGNNDAPKSLYIVPWKTSEIGVETDLTSNLLNEDMVPVDKPVFMRELDFYQVSQEDSGK